MALIYNALFTTSSIGSNRCLSLPTNAVTPFVSFPGRLDPGRRRWSSGHRRMVVQQAFQGSPATYAKEMERLSAKESLLLAFKDAGGFDALVTGKTTDVQRIDVNERITSLERLNPTPRPTTYTGPRFWKVAGISSGLGLGALVWLLPSLYLRDFLPIWQIYPVWMRSSKMEMQTLRQA